MSDKVLAVVAGKELTEADFQYFMEQLPPQQQMYANQPGAKSYFVEQMVEFYLFAQYGEDLKLDESEKYERIMANIKREVLSNMAMQECVAGISVTEEEKKAYYETTKRQFSKPATCHAKHILMENEEELKAVLADIQSKTITFEEAAKKFSTCPSGQKGGDLGNFGKGQMVPAFERAAFTGEIGTVIGPVETPFGYHLILVEDRTEEEIQEYADVEEQVEKKLIDQKQRTVYEAKVSELRAKYC